MEPGGFRHQPAIMTFGGFSSAMQRRSFLLTALAGATAMCAKADDPWPKEDVLEPAEFAKELASKAAGLSIFYVGFPVLYRSARISGAQLAGPCSKPEGLAALRKLAGSLAHDGRVVLYCGCCPFEHCPNIRPGYQAMRGLGFSRAKVLHIATNLHTDWIEKGYPTQKA